MGKRCTKVIVNGQQGFDDDLDIVDVDLPEGYRRVWRGAVKPGDLYLAVGEIREGRELWLDVHYDGHDLAQVAGEFLCLIRPDLHRGEPPDLECEMCEVAPRLRRHRYCRHCIRDIRRSARQEGEPA